MSSREEILKTIRMNKPQAVALPEINHSGSAGSQLAGIYQKALEKNGGKFIALSSVGEIENFIKDQFPKATNICSCIESVKGNVNAETIMDPHELDNLDVAVIRASTGVAENAALWISERHIVQRVLPFITQHLIIVLQGKDLVANMHEAYKRISINEDGFGVFIAGPSKTADIEQSLVIGAHGARSLTVVFIENQDSSAFKVQLN